MTALRVRILVMEKPKLIAVSIVTKTIRTSSAFIHSTFPSLYSPLTCSMLSKIHPQTTFSREIPICNKMRSCSGFHK